MKFFLFILLLIPKVAFLSGSVADEVELERLLLSSDLIVEGTLVHNKKFEKEVKYKRQKELDLYFIKFDIPESVKVKVYFEYIKVDKIIRNTIKRDVKIGDEILFVSSDYLSSLEVIPEGKWTIERINSSIISSDNIKEERIKFIASHFDTKINAYVATLNDGIILLE